VTPLAAGTCSIAAAQAGDANYLPAAQVTQDLVISLAPQTIAFAEIDSFSRRDAPVIPLVATATSGLPVVFNLVSGPCRIVGTMLVTFRPGQCVIAADQLGNNRYGRAATVTRTATVTDLITAVGGCGSTGSTSGLEILALAVAGIVVYRRRR
jgi:hypothetical protein